MLSWIKSNISRQNNQENRIGDTVLDRDFKEEASKKLSGILSQPDDLYVRLPTLKKRFFSDKMATESQLKAGINDNLDNINVIIEMTDAIETLAIEIKDNLTELEKLCIQAGSIIENYDYVKQISIAHQHANAIRQTYERFFELNNELDRISELLKEDVAVETNQGNNILLIHFYLFNVEKFQFQTLSQVKQSSSEISLMVEKYFQRLQQLDKSFQEYFWNLINNILNFILERKKKIIVKILKIIEVEEAADAAVLKLQESISLPKQDQALDTIRPIKSFKMSFLNILRESITSRFKFKLEQVKTLSIESDADSPKTSLQQGESLTPISEILSGMDFYLKDLLLIQTEIKSCFPLRYHIVDFFVINYHKNIYDIMHQKVLSRKNLKSMDILSFIGWIKEYQTTMTDRLGFDPELLDPDLLDEKVMDYSRQYVEMSKIKFKEWLHNLLQQEQKRFISRGHKPERDQDGKFISIGAADLFQIVRQVIEPTMDASYDRLMADTIRELARAISDFIRKYSKCIESETRRVMDKSDTIRAEVEEYTIMVGNSALKWIEYMSDLIQKLEGITEPAYKREVMDSLRSCNDAFVGFSKLANSILEEFIMNTLKDCMQKLFTESWYKERLIKTIIATLDDYFRDFQGTLFEFSYECLTRQICEKILLQYLTMMKGRYARFKQTDSAKLSYLLNEDKECIREFLRIYQKEEVAQSTINILERMIGLVSGPKKNIINEWLSLFKEFPDVPMDYIEDIISKRDDMDKQFLKSILEQYRSKVKIERIETFSIFSKLKI